MIREARGQQTQSEFGGRLDATKQQVSDWENGRYRPSVVQLATMGIAIVYERVSPRKRGLERQQ